MAIDAKHPLYSEFLPDWMEMRNTFRGERQVKGKGTLYLPATSGMNLDGMAQGAAGWQAYEAYRKRSVYHNFVSEAVETLLGMLTMKPATIELPAEMEPLRESATNHGKSLEVLLCRIYQEQLVSGRLGLLADLPLTSQTGAVLPYIAMYQTENIINWDDGTREGLTLQNLNFVALDESEDERTEGFEWEHVCKTRILLLGDAEANEEKGQGVYTQGVYKGAQAAFTEDNQLAPILTGTTLDQIPFVFINTKDVIARPDDPPLLDLAKLCLAIYRGEADYRQSLFMQGQDTLVVVGSVDGGPFRTGAGAAIELPIGGGADFKGVSSAGLAEQREALQNDKAEATKLSGGLVNPSSRQAESGDALRLRLGAGTASLQQIANSGAFGLQRVLRIIAEWLGKNPEEVVVTPNRDFTDERMESRTLVELVSAKTLGAPLSSQSIHSKMQEQGLTQLTFEEELSLIESEEPLVEGIGVEEEEEEAPAQEQPQE